MLLIAVDQVQRGQDFLLLVGVAALVEIIAQFPGKLFHREFFRLVETVLADFPPVVPPLHYRGEVLQLHGLRLAEMLIPSGISSR